jgi:hypothetical protein
MVFGTTVGPKLPWTVEAITAYGILYRDLDFPFPPAIRSDVQVGLSPPRSGAGCRVWLRCAMVGALPSLKSLGFPIVLMWCGGLLPRKPNQTKPNQPIPNHTKPNQKTNQTKPNQTKPNQTAEPTPPPPPHPTPPHPTLQFYPTPLGRAVAGRPGHHHPLRDSADGGRPVQVLVFACLGLWGAPCGLSWGGPCGFGF